MSAGIHAPAASTPATARIVGVFMGGIKAQIDRSECWDSRSGRFNLDYRTHSWRI